MCTAIHAAVPAPLFGRNLDLEQSCGEEIVFCPRRFPLPLRHLPALERHHALLGMAIVRDGFPLYFDAVSEHGLAMAGLHFPQFCAYHPPRSGAVNLAPFELIPYVLGTCRAMAEARALLSRVSLCDTPFSAALPNTPLHFMLAAGDDALVIESTSQGLCVYDNPAHVLTNSPPFPWHMQRLCDFMGVSCAPAENRFSQRLDLCAYSRGMGAMGLPGDLSSSSRFVRAAFAQANSVCEGGSEQSAVSQLFHLLDFVAFPRGLVRLEDGRYEITRYSSCMDLNRKTYFYKTYEGGAVKSACMDAFSAESKELCLTGSTGALTKANIKKP